MRNRETTEFLERYAEYRESGQAEDFSKIWNNLPSTVRDELFSEALMYHHHMAAFNNIKDTLDKEDAKRIVVKDYLNTSVLAKAYPVVTRVRLPEGKPDNCTPIANIIATSSLYGVQQSGKKRKLFARKVMFSRNDCVIKMTGEQLFQSDLDVLLCLREISKNGLGKVYSISRRELLRRLGKNGGGSNHEWLHEVLQRLASTSLIIEKKNKFTAACRRRGSWEVFQPIRIRYTDEKDQFTFVMDEINAILYENYEFGLIDREKRIALGRSDLAKLLHGLIVSEKANKQFHRIEKIAKMAMTECEPEIFRKMIVRALKKLQEIDEVQAFWMPRSNDESVCLWRHEEPDPWDVPKSKGKYYPKAYKIDDED